MLAGMLLALAAALDGLSLSRTSGPMGTMFLGSGLLFYVIAAFSLMKIAKKTRHASDAILAWIPLLNLVLMLKIAGRPVWWVILFFIPCVGFIAWVLMWLDIAKALRRGLLMGLIAAFIPILGIPLLAFTD